MTTSQENHTIGRNICYYRIKAGLTHKDLSKRILKTQAVEIKPAALRDYEAGRCSITATRLHQIATALNVDVSTFHEECCMEGLLDKRTFKLVESFRTIKRRPSRTPPSTSSNPSPKESEP